jgi:hypothetical protein
VPLSHQGRSSSYAAQALKQGLRAAGNVARQLSVSHGKLGEVAVAAGDLTAAATAYQAGR